MRKKKSLKRDLCRNQIMNRLWKKNKILSVGNKWKNNDRKMLNKTKSSKLRRFKLRPKIRHQKLNTKKEK